MGRKVVRVLLIAFGIAVGPALLMGLEELLKSLNFRPITGLFLPWGVPLLYIACGLTTGIITYFISPRLITVSAVALQKMEKWLGDMPLSDIILGMVGLVAGLLVAFLISTFTWRLPTGWLSIPVNAVLYLVLGYLGWTVALKRRGEVNMGKDKAGAKKTEHARPKILDTSVIIDGRILDICATGVFEGVLVVPGFVLQELRHIADSADPLKRNRGRRGLDILNSMQKELDMTIRIEQKDYEDIPEVDAKLLKLTSDVNGIVVTNDYNLNKVAAVQNVPVFNINELANAVKPVVLPGEEMRLTIVKEGKEQGQGVAYLDDGTMIVVDGGKRHVGSELDVVVTGVLQTSAGRMIFGRIKNMPAAKNG